MKPYDDMHEVIVNGTQIYKGHFDACVICAGGYPNSVIKIQPLNKQLIKNQ